MIKNKKPRFGQKVNLTIQRLGINGEGVGYWHGYTIFVEGALPQEVVEARVTARHKHFGRAKVVKQLSCSNDRTDPICPLFGRCGGCQLMHLTYAQQLLMKGQRVIDALERIGKFREVSVLPCISSPFQIGYRNKIQLPVMASDSGLKLGLYAHHTNDLVEIERCYIHNSLGEKVFQQIQAILKASTITGYNYQTGEGELRHVLIKTALYTQEALVTLVTNGSGSSELRAVARQMIRAMPEVKGVVQNINLSRDNIVLGAEFCCLEGKDAITERLCGLSFKVSSASFFQVNPAQAEALYEKALEYAELTGKEIVLDAYCGVGTLSLIFARRAGQLIGVECIPEAIADAKENSVQNGIANAQFFCAQAEDFIESLTHIDLAVLNPPRKGCVPFFLEKLIVLKPQKILYISCDPATLARDLSFLCTQGYRIEKVQPFDMFPQTAHVETLVLLRFCAFSESENPQN